MGSTDNWKTHLEVAKWKGDVEREILKSISYGVGPDGKTSFIIISLHI